MEVDIKLITKLADDVWAVAKKLEVSDESGELKAISSCLHDIRAERDTDWYEKFEVKSRSENECICRSFISMLK